MKRLALALARVSVAVLLLIVATFFLSKIGDAASSYRYATDPWGSQVTRSLRSFAISDILLAIPFVLATAWAYRKVITSPLEVFVSIVAAIIVGWLEIGH